MLKAEREATKTHTHTHVHRSEEIWRTKTMGNAQWKIFMQLSQFELKKERNGCSMIFLFAAKLSTFYVIGLEFYRLSVLLWSSSFCVPTKACARAPLHNPKAFPFSSHFHVIFPAAAAAAGEKYYHHKYCHILQVWPFRIYVCEVGG